mgnify:CR=1 FL=1
MGAQRGIIDARDAAAAEALCVRIAGVHAAEARGFGPASNLGMRHAPGARDGRR